MFLCVKLGNFSSLILNASGISTDFCRAIFLLPGHLFNRHSDCSELEWMLVSLIFLYHWCFCIQTRSFDLVLLLTRPSADKVGIYYISILTITVNDSLFFWADKVMKTLFLFFGERRNTVHHPETKDATNWDLNPTSFYTLLHPFLSLCLQRTVHRWRQHCQVTIAACASSPTSSSTSKTQTSQQGDTECPEVRLCSLLSGPPACTANQLLFFSTVQS